MGIIDFIFPKNCLDCGTEGSYFCKTCLVKIARLNTYNPLTKTFSVFSYSGVIRKGIIKIKYNFAYDVVDELSKLVIQELLKNPILPHKNVILIPIPLHASRQNWRGFNQSEILGQLIAKGMNWQFNKDTLIRKKAGKTQVGLPKHERVRNIRGKFAVNPEAKIDQNATYIVFDDVLTTGSTVKEAMKVLKESGVDKVYGLTIAK